MVALHGALPAEHQAAARAGEEGARRSLLGHARRVARGSFCNQGPGRHLVGRRGRRRRAGPCLLWAAGRVSRT